jgi:hypothetical protein
MMMFEKQEFNPKNIKELADKGVCLSFVVKNTTSSTVQTLN